tara:strand:- start:1963 stop:2475 length:513 start_codon:yes stop_codon:yes gene_type:complete
MNTFTAQDMEDYADYAIKARRMLAEPTLSYWYQERYKPTKKVVDLSVLIESGIDCEFKDSCDKKWHVSKADKGLYQESIYGTKSGDYFEQCRPRMNHIHAWQGGECPLPEGFMVKVWYRNTLLTQFNDRLATSIRWCHDGDVDDIIAFEVLGLADGYVMPYDKEVSQDDS